MSELHSEVIGDGDRVVLVHGALATGAEEWSAQEPLADEGFRLVVADRRGYGKSPEVDGEDFVRDGEDIVGLLDEGGHVVAHSYGCLGAMLAAAERPASTWSLTLLEPPAFPHRRSRCRGAGGGGTRYLEPRPPRRRVAGALPRGRGDRSRRDPPGGPRGGGGDGATGPS